MPLSGPAYHTARTIEAALALKASLGDDARWLAGGTAMQLGWIEDAMQPTFIDIGAMDCGAAVSVGAGVMRLSPTATLEAIRLDPLVAHHLPVLTTAIGTIAALGVRHLATLGGNVMWGAGDLVPLLLALDASLETADGGVVSLARRGEHRDSLIIGLTVPLPTGSVAFEKVGRRAAFSPSLVTVAALVGAAGVRCAIGGGPVPPQLAVFADIPDAATLEIHFAVPDDAFATGAHRRLVAVRVLEGHLCAFNRSRRA